MTDYINSEGTVWSSLRRTYNGVAYVRVENGIALDAGPPGPTPPPDVIQTWRARAVLNGAGIGSELTRQWSREDTAREARGYEYIEAGVVKMLRDMGVDIWGDTEKVSK